jgi:hypothetical protein
LAAQARVAVSINQALSFIQSFAVQDTVVPPGTQWVGEYLGIATIDSFAYTVFTDLYQNPPGNSDIYIDRFVNPPFIRGNVRVRNNYAAPVILAGGNNVIEIWIRNNEPLSGMSIGFEISSDVEYQLVPDHGTLGYVNPEGDAVGAFDLTHIELVSIDNISPDTVLIGGAAIAQYLPAHDTLSLCYTLKVYIPPDQEEMEDAFSIDNIYWEPQDWAFCDDSGCYAPYYQGNLNSSMTNPDAPPVYFDIALPIPGDADGSGGVDIDDIVFEINYIFAGGAEPNVLAGDCDCSGLVDIDDVVYLINYVFSGGPAPRDPNGDGVPDC